VPAGPVGGEEEEAGRGVMGDGDGCVGSGGGGGGDGCAVAIF
jgi:hypothetical protein